MAWFLKYSLQMMILLMVRNTYGDNLLLDCRCVCLDTGALLCDDIPPEVTVAFVKEEFTGPQCDIDAEIPHCMDVTDSNINSICGDNWSCCRTNGTLSCTAIPDDEVGGSCTDHDGCIDLFDGVFCCFQVSCECEPVETTTSLHSPSTAAPGATDEHSGSTGVGVGIGIAICIIFVAVVVLLLYCHKRGILHKITNSAEQDEQSRNGAFGRGVQDQSLKLWYWLHKLARKKKPGQVISSYSTYLPDTAEDSNNPEEQQYDDTGIDIPLDNMGYQSLGADRRMPNFQELSRKDTENYEKVIDPKLDNQAQHTDDKSKVAIANEAQSSGDKEYAECGPATTGPLPNIPPVHPPSPHPEGHPPASQDTAIAYINQAIINHKNQRLGKH
ncbi:uncharacterized protein [Amphiura filiformis]|uniref:uncharacterized protein n=1 Tax=Amphiura filiformis TaxID=82378 RepID=UPI003B215953